MTQHKPDRCVKLTVQRSFPIEIGNPVYWSFLGDKILIKSVVENDIWKANDYIFDLSINKRSVLAFSARINSKK